MDQPAGGFPRMEDRGALSSFGLSPKERLRSNRSPRGVEDIEKIYIPGGLENNHERFA
jgi:hypothetical protein